MGRPGKDGRGTIEHPSSCAAADGGDHLVGIKVPSKKEEGSVVGLALRVRLHLHSMWSKRGPSQQKQADGYASTGSGDKAWMGKRKAKRRRECYLRSTS